MEEFPDVFAYMDYRKFLWDAFSYLKVSKNFTTRDFAKLAGLRDPNYLKLLCDNKRHLKSRTARSIAQKLGLNSQHVDFFEALVRFGNAKSSAERDECLKKVLNFKSFRKIYPHAALELTYFQKWQNVAFFEAIDTIWETLDIPTQARALGVPPKDLQQTVQLLLKLGWLKTEGTLLKKREHSIETPSEVHHHNIRNMHREMLSLGLKALDELPVQERFFSGLTMALTPTQAEDLKKTIFEFLSKLPKRYSDHAGATQIYHLETLLIPLLAKSNAKSES